MLVLVALVAPFLGGCEVTNPGPVQDEFLNDATTHEGLVRGSERNLLIGSMRLFFAAATVSREVFPGGDINSHSPRLQYGALPSDEMSEYWDNTQQARFIAEDAITRFANPDVTVDPEVEAQAHIWAGYANKLLGEYFCEVVFDGGAAEAPVNALTRAEANFTNAIGLAGATGAQMQAAYAGRAQTRVEMGDWSGAVSDAAMVDDDFVLGIEADEAFVATRNFIAFANFNENYRQYTYHFTYYFDDLGMGFGTGYYTNTGDPRIRWAEDPNFPVANASLPGYGNVPWSFDPDFPLDDPIIMSTGTEMRLYEAENILLTAPASFMNAIDIINDDVRAQFTSDNGGTLAPWAAPADAAAAGTIYKDEKMIDGHLRGRRFLDLRRWGGIPGVAGSPVIDATPGSYYWPDWGATLTSVFDDEPMATCFPIPDEERDINTNVQPEGSVAGGRKASGDRLLWHSRDRVRV
jgi:hypothetical protein